MIFFLTIEPLYIVVEYASNGNLRDFLRERRPANFFSSQQKQQQQQQQQQQQDTEESIIVAIDNLIFFALQIAKGMSFLAENDVSNC